METETKTDRLLSTKDMLGKLKTSDTTLWRLVKAEKIPKPIKLTERGNNLYKESWINDFIDSLDSGKTDIKEDPNDRTGTTIRRRVKRSEA